MLRRCKLKRWRSSTQWTATRFEWKTPKRCILEAKLSSSTRDIPVAHELGISQRTVNHLHKSGFVHKKPRQVPHALTELQAARRVEICRHLLENSLDNEFWKFGAWIVTTDKKWVYLVSRDRWWVHREENPYHVVKSFFFQVIAMVSKSGATACRTLAQGYRQRWIIFWGVITFVYNMFIFHFEQKKEN